MIRTVYPLPEPEKDCNAVSLILLDVRTGTAEVQPGAADLDPVTMAPVDGTFVPDPDVRTLSQRVADPAHFLAWYAAHEKNPADWEGQQIASGLLLYLWLQRKDQLPNE